MWHLVKAGEPGANSGDALKVYNLDERTDINTPPTGESIAVGSTAYCVDDNGLAVWHKNNSAWKPLM